MTAPQSPHAPSASATSGGEPAAKEAELAAEREECLRVLDEVLPYVGAFPGRAARVAENCIHDLAARLRSAPSEDIGGELFLQSIADEPVTVIPSDGLPPIDPSLVQNESAFRREPSVCEKCGWPLYACGGHDPDEPASLTPPLTPAERAAEMYPDSMVRHSRVNERAAYFCGHADGKAEGYARAIEACARYIETRDWWADRETRTKAAAGLRALAAGKE